MALLATGLVGLACSGKQPVLGPIETGDPVVEGRQISWVSSTQTMGFVRYGESAFELDRVAYPVAAGRRDRALVTQHRVPLLSLSEGVEYFYQVGNEAQSGGRAWGEVRSFTASVGPAEAILTSTMINIGWGDAHLITLPTNGTQVLLDAGDSGASTSVQYYLDEQGIADIDHMLATHVHADHIGGFVGSY